MTFSTISFMVTSLVCTKELWSEVWVIYLLVWLTNIYAVNNKNESSKFFSVDQLPGQAFMCYA